MAKVILGVIKSDSKRKKLIEQGHVQARKYSWKKMAEETLEIYKNAISGNSLK